MGFGLLKIIFLSQQTVACANTFSTLHMILWAISDFLRPMNLSDPCISGQTCIRTWKKDMYPLVWNVNETRLPPPDLWVLFIPYLSLMNNVTWLLRLNSDIRIIPTSSKLMAEKLVTLFFNNWYCENGLPLELISDHDKLFML